ncbi:hypothetical protein GJ698_14985 [Pseudoduganella sp. FT26W]|uniref:Uncharacterized protein n=1 Tax=Duganella aquatilis TaxID=2666082 RepID=A0A844DCS4_9BURK|nr:hypothetical protein [Duganella aquatilis]MRW85389.1 hypothetical protein [Duganella aquatilis]
MDYAKYVLAHQLLSQAKPELAAALKAQTGREPLQILPSSDLQAIVWDALDELEKVVTMINGWSESHGIR